MAITNDAPVPRAFIAEVVTNDAGEKGLSPTFPWSTFFRNLRDDIDNTPRILPSASVTEADLNASVGATTMITPDQSGLFGFQYYAAVITADGVSSSLTVLLDWTQAGVAKSKTFTAMTGNTTTTNASEDYLVYADAGAPVRYTLTYASNTPGAMHYSFYAVLQSVTS